MPVDNSVLVKGKTCGILNGYAEYIVSHNKVYDSSPRLNPWLFRVTRETPGVHLPGVFVFCLHHTLTPHPLRRYRMPTIYDWVDSLAGYFRAPFLSAKRLRGLRKDGMILMTREDTDILALAALIPINRIGVVLAGLWVAEGSGPETGKKIVGRAIQLSHMEGLTVIVPLVFLPYVEHVTTPLREAGVSLKMLECNMKRAGIPSRHPIRLGGLQVIPAPVREKNVGPISPGQNCCEL